MNISKGFVLAMITYIPMFVLGGFFLTKLPAVAEALSHLAIVKYSFHAIAQVNHGPDIKFQ